MSNDATHRVFIGKKAKCDWLAGSEQEAIKSAAYRYPSIGRAENVSAKLIQTRCVATGFDGRVHEGPWQNTQLAALAALEDKLKWQYAGVGYPMNYMREVRYELAE
jgi:hypothetical protein